MSDLNGVLHFESENSNNVCTFVIMDYNIKNLEWLSLRICGNLLILQQ